MSAETQMPSKCILCKHHGNNQESFDSDNLSQTCPIDTPNVEESRLWAKTCSVFYAHAIILGSRPRI
eukprot:1698581-Amphidinium_carterae.1